MTVILQQLSPDQFDTAALVEAVLSESPDLPRGYAMSLLLGAQYPGTRGVLQQVIENEDEPSSVRTLAVRHLGLLEPCSVQSILLRRTSTRDERVLREIVRVLGWIGDVRALPAVQEVADRSRGRLAEAAAFAAMLIAYRSGRLDCSFTPPDPLETVAPPGGCRLRAAHNPVSLADFTSCLMSLGDEPLGIEYSPRLATAIHFEDIRWTLLFNREVAEGDGLERIRSSNQLLGAVAERDPKDDTDYLLLVILSTPTDQKGEILVHAHDPNGELIYLGRAVATRDGLAFAVRTISRTALILEIEGTCGPDGLRFDEFSYAREPGEKRVPATL
ncbi:MAG: hypothetical protein GEU90_09600 [Gemmatimonas sp.]|nr:hypothetical protein [Gemmatimonas sp.]